VPYRSFFSRPHTFIFSLCSAFFLHPHTYLPLQERSRSFPPRVAHRSANMAALLSPPAGTRHPRPRISTRNEPYAPSFEDAQPVFFFLPSPNFFPRMKQSTPVRSRINPPQFCQHRSRSDHVAVFRGSSPFQHLLAVTVPQEGNSTLAVRRVFRSFEFLD